MPSLATQLTYDSTPFPMSHGFALDFNVAELTTPETGTTLLIVHWSSALSLIVTELATLKTRTSVGFCGSQWPQCHSHYVGDSGRQALVSQGGSFLFIQHISNNLPWCGDFPGGCTKQGFDIIKRPLFKAIHNYRAMDSPGQVQPFNCLN